MKWAYSIENKLKAALVLSVIFVFLFIKNISDQNSFIELGNSFSVVYEDRLLAESYIYEFSDHLSRKKLLIDDNKDAQTLSQHLRLIDSHNTAVQQLIAAYEKTKLTPTEEVLFRDLKRKINLNITLEKQYLQAMSTSTNPSKQALDESFYSILSNLNQLSHIQINEGERLNKTSQKIVLGSESQNQFELSILIVLGVIILVLIFSSKSTYTKIPQKSSLN
ncbi:hypothetical protein Emtol_1042 [Emticicia oligotrophica DSM 17448]|uniref:Chemotaxis methyl-accepting receptor HlyB-like 4HB MCP domain-containing protein n=1 Tax=Emticicia oligotrophica (strain DSM 17448 / CIP 109782 / MTCC 6937 / GPTSA100-15) TaxID=929562 RepID=A0ABM5MYH0_EMTOG|nr:MCP four helix bundle domain-containing protein [Emticicia oligotrophica]AFK02192.1 hypothetical protein Emtol_1042 [Emticicia oligotrophica DSM 17448]